jgi:hypothetical protein
MTAVLLILLVIVSTVLVAMSAQVLALRDNNARLREALRKIAEDSYVLGIQDEDWPLCDARAALFETKTLHHRPF